MGGHASVGYSGRGKINMCKWSKKKKDGQMGSGSTALAVSNNDANDNGEDAGAGITALTPMRSESQKDSVKEKEQEVKKTDDVETTPQVNPASGQIESDKEERKKRRLQEMIASLHEKNDDNDDHNHNNPDGKNDIDRDDDGFDIG